MSFVKNAVAGIPAANALSDRSAQSDLELFLRIGDVGRQLGLLPGPGSLGERAMVLAQQLRVRLRRS